MNYIKGFLTSKKFEAFLWMTLNGLIGAVVVYLTDINFVYAMPVIAMLNVITKYINTKYIKN